MMMCALVVSMTKYSELIYLFSNTTFLLGAYNLAADAALAYDIAHRLMMEMMSIGGDVSQDAVKNTGDSELTERVKQLELRKLEELEKDSNASSPSLDWMENASGIADGMPDKDGEKFNFNTPQEFYTAREKEITERKMNSSTNTSEDASGTYPEISVLKMMIRKDAITVTKAVIVSDAGNDEKKRKRDDSAHENAVSFDYFIFFTRYRYLSLTERFHCRRTANLQLFR
jgi:hypothetical protein